MKPLVCSSLLCVFLSALGWAQTVESAACIEKNTVQIELESQYRVEREGSMRERSWIEPGALFRFGLLDRLELQLGMPAVQEWVAVNDEPVSSLGRFGDAQLGCALNLWKQGKFIEEGAIMARAVVPISGRPDITGLGSLLSLNLSRPILPELSLGFNIGAATSASGGSSGFYIANFDYAPTPKVHCFLEYSNVFQKACSPLHTMGAGFGIGVTESLAIDFSVARSLDQDLFYSGGILTWVLGD